MAVNLGSWIEAGVLLLAAVIYYLWSWRQRSNVLHLPPGPPPFPVIGNLLQLSRNIHRDFAKLGEKYGPLMYLRIGAVPVVVVQNAVFAREILKTHDKVFANRPQDIAVATTLFEGDDLGFSPVSPHWRYLKKVCVSLIDLKRLATFKVRRSPTELVLLRSLHFAAHNPCLYFLRSTIWI